MGGLVGQKRGGHDGTGRRRRGKSKVKKKKDGEIRDKGRKQGLGELDGK